MILERPRFDAVCFDCDSTLTNIEGIDELADRAGCGPEIAKLTEAAMSGLVPLEEVYAKRLEIVRPDRSALAWLAERYAEAMVSGAAETIATLKWHGKAVYVITGGLLQAVVEFTSSLGFAPERRPFAPHLTLGRWRENAATANRARLGARYVAWTASEAAWRCPASFAMWPYWTQMPESSARRSRARR